MIPFEIIEVILAYMCDISILLEFQNYIGTKYTKYILQNALRHDNISAHNLRNLVNIFKERNLRVVIKYFKYSAALKNALVKKINWKNIDYISLKPEFITEFSTDLDWELVSKYSILSDKFIVSNATVVYWHNIKQYQKFDLSDADNIYNLNLELNAKYFTALDINLSRIQYKTIKNNTQIYKEYHDILFKACIEDKYSKILCFSKIVLKKIRKSREPVQNTIGQQKETIEVVILNKLLLKLKDYVYEHYA